MLLTYFLNDFEMVPVAPILTGITLVFTFIIIIIIIGRRNYLASEVVKDWELGNRILVWDGNFLSTTTIFSPPLPFQLTPSSTGYDFAGSVDCNLLHISCSSVINCEIACYCSYLVKGEMFVFTVSYVSRRRW